MEEMTEGYNALENGVAWLDLSARGRIVARGRDRVRFLHNITSNDVRKLTPGSSCYAFLLSPQGRIQADLYLLAFDDHFLIDTEPELREKVRQHILKYKVADQVELEDVTATTACLGVEGPGAEAIKSAIMRRGPGAVTDRASALTGAGAASRVRRLRVPAWALRALRSAPARTRP